MNQTSFNVKIIVLNSTT